MHGSGRDGSRAWTGSLASTVRMRSAHAVAANHASAIA
jgi:hypothetical protein